MDATNFYLKQRLQELEEKLEKSQVQESSEICGLKLSQLAAYESDLAKDTTKKDSIKAEMETFKGNL